MFTQTGLTKLFGRLLLCVTTDQVIQLLCVCVVDVFIYNIYFEAKHRHQLGLMTTVVEI